jgi:hypothetical protein
MLGSVHVQYVSVVSRFRRSRGGGRRESAMLISRKGKSKSVDHLISGRLLIEICLILRRLPHFALKSYRDAHSHLGDHFLGQKLDTSLDYDSSLGFILQ